MRRDPGSNLEGDQKSVYLSLLAWSVSVFYYQAATFAEHPQTSLFWLVFVSILLSVEVQGLSSGRGKFLPRIAEERLCLLKLSLPRSLKTQP